MADFKILGIPATFQIEAGDLATDSGLENAVALSLFLDRRAGEEDTLPDNETDPRGWWGDAFFDEDGDQIGSRLWLLSREKTRANVLPAAEDYATEALDWMVRDGVASSVTCTASFESRKLYLKVLIVRPTGEQVGFRHDLNWEQLAA